MTRQVKVEVIKRLIARGLIFEADVACDVLNVSRKQFPELN